ncbi:YqcI/YcgG family-domain-containing protein [Hygrophoropsis aurantiaca]|uniref:YqcI/YcgG family-domain-containing protein n=1 Tax=Hygrophoropsis aurantiaca TaxID=72124 RepID=A0ACB8A5D0_9AGAM|nr:YqcI/YcgG family-domain-containing protein [Hygrophoropsis aurantiaca]
MIDIIYYLATSIIGGVVLTLFANAASIKLPSVLKNIRSTFLSFTDAVPIALGVKTSRDHRSKPLTRAEVTATFADGTWQRQAYEQYKAVLLDEEVIFPCIYATKGFKTDDQLYIFIDSDDLSDPRHIRSLASALSTYLPQSRGLGPNTSLVLLAQKNDSPRSVDQYNSEFWQLLNGLAKLDTKPWPSQVPRDIDTDNWCFCFGGEPFFTVIQTPAHQVRRSRYANGLTIVFQPKWIFDILFSSDAKRAGALAKVRALLAKYEAIPVSPELKNYGEEGSREAKQYFLLDENVPAPCPFDQLSPSETLGA